ncbi:hypothetical protein F3Y22_tig00005459pilonHSYRG00102 [Hibiscus syriacus]|uniref:C2 domain-containing protein n=1 Tax=Hibiscus syriacus TaxID=106335 RepID=A0A6A3CFJ4_HIBSY|nr:hypothetical protein F3Y22_tig00005459pilonHSYRG00102 [Hibiscus syriacus]
MHYLFLRVVKARDLACNTAGGTRYPFVEIKIGNYKGTTKYFESRKPNPEWNQVSAFAKDRIQSLSVEITVREKGNGQKVDFWFDAWLDDYGPLINHVTSAGAIGLQKVTAADMVDAQGNWRGDCFESFLLVRVLLSIAAKRGPLAHFASDMVGWNLREDRKFTIKSAYESLDEDRNMEADELWMVIHNLNSTVVLEEKDGQDQLADGAKVNTDGARNRVTGLSSCGGVIRNHGGEWKMGFAKFIRICSVLEAELSWDSYVH